ncbi:MAG: polymer-forming cytoskeletal protein [Candidatus Aminicenantaceae bacterium]
MKHRGAVLAVALVLLLMGSVPLFGQQGFSLKNDIVVESGDVQENVFSIGGSIHIKGKVEKTVIAIGGTIIVEGEVGEAVMGIGTEIILKSSGRIEGDLVAFGGTLTKAPGAVIEGDTVYFKADEGIGKLIQEGLFGRTGISLIPLLIILRLIMAFIWFILAVVLLAIFPRQVTFAADQIRKAFWPVFVTGVLCIVVFSGLVVFAALLSLVLIGLPILAALIIIGVIIKIFGQVILFFFFGELVYKAFSRKPTPPFLAVTVGFVLVTVIGMIPILGALFSLVLSIIGWGVVIRTKFGNTPNWFKKAA